MQNCTYAKKIASAKKIENFDKIFFVFSYSCMKIIHSRLGGSWNVEMYVKKYQKGSEQNSEKVTITWNISHL